MERVYELLEQLADAIIKEFPDMTDASFIIKPNGYRSIGVDKWDPKEDAPVEAWLRRSLCDKHVRYDGVWSEDRSKEQNAYYAEQNKLLKEGA